MVLPVAILSEKKRKPEAGLCCGVRLTSIEEEIEEINDEKVADCRRGCIAKIGAGADP
jgi:hypothetical protein